MDDETRQWIIRAAISAALVFVGWFLAIGTDMFRKWLQNRRLKKGLKTEIQDLKYSLDVARTHYLHRLKAYAVGAVEIEKMIPLSNFIFSNNYSEINLKLNRNQRRSYETIHGFVDIYNKQLDTIWDLTQEFAETNSPKVLDKLGQMLKGQYLNVEILRLRIKYHLENPKYPALENNEKATGEYLEAEKEIIEQIESLIEEWKNGTIEGYLADKQFRYKILTMPYD